MKNLEQDKLKTLLTIIGTNPSLQLAHFSDDGDILVDAIHNYTVAHDYYYYLHCTNEDFYKKNQEKFKETENTIVRNLTLNRPSYMMQGKQYDFIFITTQIDEDFREEFLKRIHKIVLNAGNILIFIPKGDVTQRYHWISLLEETLYVATSTIDDLFEHYDVIISKKMHGWGNL